MRTLPDIEVLTPDEPGLAAGITSFRVKTKGSREDNNALVAALRDRHKVLTVRRDGVAKGQCIRVSPALYTTEDEDRFAAALAAETARVEARPPRGNRRAPRVEGEGRSGRRRLNAVQTPMTLSDCTQDEAKSAGARVGSSRQGQLPIT